ncbi:hypothetical protein VTK73DRAFT_724 [Phialemonium thermophilum]|uniref:Uncharacterized protein n=1 Tax=Phialemonium thermophilum TaxID=223376 RepID=A0ABR3VUE1_9PEZI
MLARLHPLMETLHCTLCTLYIAHYTFRTIHFALYTTHTHTHTSKHPLQHGSHCSYLGVPVSARLGTPTIQGTWTQQRATLPETTATSRTRPSLPLLLFFWPDGAWGPSDRSTCSQSAGPTSEPGDTPGGWPMHASSSAGRVDSAGWAIPGTQARRWGAAHGAADGSRAPDEASRSRCRPSPRPPQECFGAWPYGVPDSVRRTSLATSFGPCVSRAGTIERARVPAPARALPSESASRASPGRRTRKESRKQPVRWWANTKEDSRSYFIPTFILILWSS